MKVKELMKKLAMTDPNADVCIKFTKPEGTSTYHKVGEVKEHSEYGVVSIEGFHIFVKVMP